jgi:hypothetical protein
LVSNGEGSGGGEGQSAADMALDAPSDFANEALDAIDGSGSSSEQESDADSDSDSDSDSASD